MSVVYRLAERELDDLGGAPPSPAGSCARPACAHERQPDRAVRGERGAARRPTSRSPRAAASRADRRAQPQPAQVAVGLAAVVQPRDGLLADIAALREETARSLRPASCGIVLSSTSTP